MQYLASDKAKSQQQIRFHELLKKDEKELKSQLNFLDSKRKKNKHNSDFDVRQNLALVKDIICVILLLKVNEFVKAAFHGRKLLIEELVVLLLCNTDDWNSKTKKRSRKITIADVAQMIGCCSSSVTKIITIFKKAEAKFNEYRFLKALFDKFLKAGIKTRMFKWLLDWVTDKYKVITEQTKEIPNEFDLYANES